VLVLVQMLVALEMLLLPPCVAAVVVGRPARPGRRLARGAAAALLVTTILVVLAFLVGAGTALAVLKAQAVAVAFVAAVGGAAMVGRRVRGPRFGQMLATLVGWALVGSVLWAGPAADLLDGPAVEALVRAAAHANPLLVAERELGLDWLHQGLTYRLSPLGESYAFYVRGLAWWKTALAHVFVGSGLAVFGLPGRNRQAQGPQPLGLD
jgi:hypothetical protein